MSKLTQDERAELKSLRLYKLEMEAKGRVKAFARLRQLKEAHHDAIISIRAFNAISDCLEALNEDLTENKDNICK